LRRPSFDGWGQALKSAEDALVTFREADSQHMGGDVGFANASIKDALLELHNSTEAIPTMYRSDFIMTGWDNHQIGEA
jgi:hypothetical protein